MHRLLLLIIFPSFIFAQQPFQSEMLYAKSSNKDIFFDFELDQLDTLPTEGKENVFQFKIEVSGVSPKEFQKFLDQGRYRLIFEKEHFKLPHLTRKEGLKEVIGLKVKPSLLYLWDIERGCLSWRNTELMARSDLPLSYQYEVILIEGQPPAAIPLPRIKE